MDVQLRGSHQTNASCRTIRQGRIVRHMYTIIETEIFKRYAQTIWDDGESGVHYLAGSQSADR